MIRASGNSLQIATHRVDTVHVRHLQVHQRNVWPVLSELFERLVPGRSLCHQLHIRLTRDQCSDAFTQHRMVVNRENPDYARVGAHDLVPFSYGRSGNGCGGNASYAIDPGMLNSTSVPAPSSLQTANCAPICLARSRNPGKPQCPERPPCSRTFGSMPFPSSRKRRRSKSSPYVISVSIFRAWAWRKAFCNDSRAMRYISSWRVGRTVFGVPSTKHETLQSSGCLQQALHSSSVISAVIDFSRSRLANVEVRMSVIASRPSLIA